MRRWDLTVPLDSSQGQPLFLQLARAIADDIRRGRLKPGESLPSSRELAGRIGINRNTVKAGYSELAAEGLISARARGGTFVAELANEPVAPRAQSTLSPTYALGTHSHLLSPRLAPAPGTLVLSNGLPDVRLFPSRALARAFRRAIEHRHTWCQSDSFGNIRLRDELAGMLSRTRGIPALPEAIIVTRSIEHSIDLVARTLIRPNDVVVVEEFGYPPAWSAFKLAGARLESLPLDNDGLDVAALASLLTRQRIRAIFLTPHHQFPTTTVMSQHRRARLAELSLQHRFVIIEDDYDHELHYEGNPVLPIAAGPYGANVIYIGSLADLLAPGLSTGFLVAPRVVCECLASVRAASDARGDAAMECAIAELFEDGELLRHVLRVRRVYAARRDALAAALKHHLGTALSFRVPEGGMALWAHVDEDIDLDGWVHAGEREGVTFCGADPYDFFHRDRPFLRLGFSYHDEAELDEAVRRMRRALARMA